MSVSLAIFDLIPVAMFFFTGRILRRAFAGARSAEGRSMLCAGTLMVFLAGLCKGIWKLLYCTGVCDFERLNQCFMPMQAMGFLLIAAAMLLLVGGRRRVRSAAPPLFSGTMIFVSFMCLGVLVMAGVLSVMAARLKKAGLISLFALAALGMLGMGYLSSQDFSSAAMNWIAESVNLFAQASLLLGVYLLDKAGLKEYNV